MNLKIKNGLFIYTELPSCYNSSQIDIRINLHKIMVDIDVNNKNWVGIDFSIINNEIDFTKYVTSGENDFVLLPEIKTLIIDTRAKHLKLKAFL